MSFEIVWDHRDAVAATGIKFNYRHEVLEPSEYVLWARRFMGCPELMVYRHRVRGSFVLTDLIYPDSMIGREIKVMPCPPDHGGWVGQRWLQAHMRPLSLTLDELSTKWADDRVVRQNARERSEEGRKDVQKHLKRHGDEDIARALEYQPYDVSDRTEDSAKFINQIVRRK